MAIRSDRIVYVGDAAGAAALRGPNTEVVEFAGRLVTPGFNDSHIHLVEGALSLDEVDLSEDQSLEAVQARIAAFATADPRSPWVRGHGWLYGSFPGGLPTKAQLDAVLADRPAYMECYDAHSGWGNSKARALVKAKIPEPDQEARYRLLLRALRQLNAQGITSVQDARTDSATLQSDLPLLERAIREGKLTGARHRGRADERRRPWSRPTSSAVSIAPRPARRAKARQRGRGCPS